MFGDSDLRTGGPATDPENYFALANPGSPGISPGTTAIGSPDMPLAGALKTLDAINSNPNLSPTMLGGQQNAGMMADRMGNLIYSPGAPQVVSFLHQAEPPPSVRNAMSELISGAPQAEPPLRFRNAMSELISGAPQADIPITLPAMPNFTNRGIGSVSSANAATGNYPAMTPQTSTGLASGSMAIGSPNMPMYGAMNTMNAIGSNPYLSPTMLGGEENAGFFTDRMGNQITAPGMPRRFYAFAKGGDVDLEALMAQNAETLSDEQPEDAINTNPVGTAQQMLADLSGAGKPSPTRQAIKRTKIASGGGAEADKAMQLIYEDLAKGDLGSMKDRPPAARNTESARSQMEELARIYQLKIRAAQEQAKGLSANTFGAPTLETPTLTKNRLTKKRFKDGGEAKKSDVRYRVEGSPEEGEESSDGFYAPFFRAALGIPEEGETSIKDQLIGAGETALTLGSGAVSSLVGMPYGLYKGLTSGKYLEGKAPQIADKEAADFIERNTYVPRSQSGKENLEALSKITDALKLAPTPGGAAMASLARPKAVQAQAANMAKDFQQYNRQLAVPGASYAVPPQSRAVTPAPASNLGFYSAAEQAALNLPRKEGPGNAFLNDLMKASDVKKEELTSMGLDEFLKGKPKVTRQEVQDFIANNRIDVKEVQLGGNVVEDPAGIAKRKAVFDKYEPEIQALYRQIDFDTYDPALSNRLTELQSARDREADAAYVVPEPAPTRFDNPRLVLPGGKNYREILLTTPVRGEAELDAAQIAAGDLRRQTTDLMGEWRAASELNPGTPGTVALYQKLRDSVKLRDQAEATALELRKKIRSQTYKSSHFNQPNVLAHLRVNDRVDADGKKMLLIEELQSDWHQTGREKGYNTSERQLAEQKKLDNLLAERQQLGERQKQLEELALPYTSQGKDAPRDILNEWNSVSNRLNMLQTEQNRLGRSSNEGVPDAPFKDTWHQLALKRALKYAADNGYERVGLTTGMQQAQRYNMAEKVDNISYEPTEKGFYINVISKNGANVLRGDYSAKELEGIVGREVTKKMMAKEGRNEFNPEIEPDLAEVRRLEGDDLQVASEGMKKYYDEIYPAFLVKQGKKFNAATGITQIKTEPIAPAYVDYIVGRGNFTDTTVLGVRADGSTEIVNQNANSLQEAQQLANRYKEKHLEGGKEAVRYIDITPEMKGAVPYTKGGEVDKNTAFIKAHS